jgi:hypothetical protein
MDRKIEVFAVAILNDDADLARNSTINRAIDLAPALPPDPFLLYGRTPELADRPAHRSLMVSIPKS